MRIKLSAYWWCQIIGWSAFYVSMLLNYFSFLGFSILHFAAFLFLVIVVLGISIAHTIRLLITKIKILQLNIIKQVICVFFIIIFFSFVYAALIVSFNKRLHWGDEFINSFPNSENSMLLILGFTYQNFFLLGLWNLIYISYHYVKKSQREEIKRVRLESELKIQQLENENVKLQFQRNIADVSFTALRSQMNPHFIFNCLNSIKLYTEKGNTETASEYLTRFSVLIRLVMENSGKEKVLLSSELDTLQLYIEMEAMRFKEKLQYNIIVEENVETDYIELPPLLLQPYVENAIWHGLMHKDEGGKIDIRVAMNSDNSLLKISITDNGIGRARSAELKKKKAIKHESYGMKVTSERIALINLVYKTGAEVQIDDLMDTNGNSMGTKVIIQIPV